MPLIEFKQVNLSFDQQPILQDFSLRIFAGEQVVIFGKSGLGKSTLLKLILGFVQPESGAVLINGQPLSGDNVQALRAQIAYVDQDTMIGEGQVLAAIKEYLAFASNRHLRVTEADIEQLMNELDLRSDLLLKNISELSGGERQRMAIVIALLLQRPLLVLDEATASLDPASKKIVIRKLTGQQNRTLLVVTHDQEWKKLPQVKLFDFKDKQWTQ